jgi:hypothetical protein
MKRKKTKTDADKAKWENLHEARVALRQNYVRAEKALVSRLDGEVRAGRMTQEEAAARRRHWELYDAPPMCLEARRQTS